MTIIDALIETVAAQSERSQVVDVCVGACYTVVVLDTPHGRSGGLAATGAESAGSLGGPVGVGRPLALGDQTPTALLELAHAQGAEGSALAVATINALLQVDESRCTERNARDLILEIGRGKRVAVVGHFPFVPQVHRVASHLDVLELHPRPGDLPACRAADVIPRADVVALTGTTLLNGTFDALIRLCRPDAYVLLLGGSTPLSPIFFDLGVDAVAGTLLVDLDAAVNAVRQGAGFRQIPGKRLLLMERS